MMSRLLWIYLEYTVARALSPPSPRRIVEVKIPLGHRGGKRPSQPNCRHPSCSPAPARVRPSVLT